MSTAAEEYVAKELLQTLRSNGEADWEAVELSDDECEAAVVAAVNATVTPTGDLSDSGSSWVNLSDSLTLEEGPTEFDSAEPRPPGPTMSLSVPRGLHIALLVCGTRGDVQPFIFIGRRLQQDGHRVKIAEVILITPSYPLNDTSLSSFNRFVWLPMHYSANTSRMLGWNFGLWQETRRS